MQRAKRAVTTYVVLAVVAGLCVACGSGPSERPVVAVVEHAPGADRPTNTTQAPPPAPVLDRPKGELAWSDCTADRMQAQNLPPGPPGLILECAEFTAPMDAEGKAFGTFAVGALRALLPQTPRDAPPMVFTTGADRPSTQALAAWAAGPATSLLAARPIVAVDRRGIGTSTQLDCVRPTIKRPMSDLAQFSTNGGDQADALAKLAQDATIDCKDALQPLELAFDAVHAADDINQLRLNWQVERIGIIGAGNGSRVALSYAQKYGAHVGRLVLDAPEPYGIDVLTMTENRLKGADAAVKAFANRCVGLRCSLGPDPYGAIRALLERARTGAVPGVSSNAVATAVMGFLGSPRGDQNARVTVLADALSAAARGTTGPLIAIVDEQRRQTGEDGQLVTRCSDATGWPPVARARELAKTWGEKYPMFGSEVALGLLSCSAWPAVPVPAPPKEVNMPVLAMSSAADPTSGDGGVGPVSGVLNNAGAQVSAITWQGAGHPVLPHSSCAQELVINYANSGKLPSNGTVCPA